MIVRIFQVEIFEDKVEEFRSFFLEKALPMMREQDGLISITPCHPHTDSPCEFALVMVWKDEASIARFVGENWREPHIDPAEEGIVRSRLLHHYQLAQ